jgi:hypothetical protein
MALHMLRIAIGGYRGEAEAERMISEKFSAAVTAQSAGIAVALTDGNSQHVAKKMISVYKSAA